MLVSRRPLSILHAIHDFLPRHLAGSEIYAFELCRALAKRHHVWVLCAEYDPTRPHGHITWRLFDGLPVIEIVNNWRAESFEDTYRPPLIGDRVRHVLQVLQPDVVHVHNLLNLSFDLPAAARARGAAVVATLHDYTLVCPSGGQRLHHAERHLCDWIDSERCARCFMESPFHAQMSFGRVATLGATAPLYRAASALAQRLPGLATRAARAVSTAPVTAAEIDARLRSATAVFDDIDLFVAPASFTAAEFGRLGVPPDKIRVSDYGFAEWQPAPRTNAAKPLRIGYVGSVVWHKGVHVLLDAVRRLPSADYAVKVFGDLRVAPAYAADLEARAAGLPVRMMGAFDRRSIADVYAQIDVLVVPSIWLENSPLVIHEAIRAGVPVVGARIGGIPDLVRHEENGLLFDADSSQSLAVTLQSLLDRPQRLDEFRARLPAIKSIDEDSHEWEDRYSTLIEQLASRLPA